MVNEEGRDQSSKVTVTDRGKTSEMTYEQLVRRVADEVWKRWQRQLRRERNSMGSRRK